MAKANNVQLVGFEDSIFTREQLAFVQEQAQLLQSWVQRYQILPESVELEEAEDFESDHPGQVFTLAFSPSLVDDQKSLRYGVVPGVYDDEEEFFLSALPCEDELESFPYTIIDLICSVCGGTAAHGADCSNCETGELSLDLYWDTDWQVTAEYSRSEPED